MNFEKIEEAYTLLLENVQVIQNKLSTNFYDALIEQNGIYLDGQTDLEIVKKNHQTLKSLKLRRVAESLSVHSDEGCSDRAFASQSSVYTRCHWFSVDFYHRPADGSIRYYSS